MWIREIASAQPCLGPHPREKVKDGVFLLSSELWGITILKADLFLFVYPWVPVGYNCKYVGDPFTSKM